MASLLIFPAIVAFVTVSFSSARHWLLVGGAALAACLVTCGSCFPRFEFDAPTSLLAAAPFRNVSFSAEALQSGVFGRLADPRVLAFILVAVIVFWIINAWPTWSRDDDTSQSERFQGLITIGVLGVLAWIVFSYRF